jgi:hypothetical protein
MKTNINLYSQELHPTLRLLSLGIILVCWLLLVSLLIGFWVFSLKQQDNLEQELNMINQKRDHQSTLVATLQNGLEMRQSDPQLLQDVNNKVLELALKKLILQELQSQESLKEKGFANVMLDLANHHQPGLWLTHVALNGLDVRLEGEAVESAIVPSWINRLGQTAYFKGQKFADTRLFRDSNQQLHFVISSSSLAHTAETNEVKARE